MYELLGPVVPPRWAVGDFNGDGKSDLAMVFADNGFMSIDAHMNQGSTFTLEHLATMDGSWPFMNLANQSESGAFDGNGQADIAMEFLDNGQVSIDVHRTGKFDRACTPTAMSYKQTYLDGSWMGDIDAEEMQGIAQSSQHWFWISRTHVYTVPIVDIDSGKRSYELEGVTAYRGADGLNYVLAVLLHNLPAEEDSVSLYGWYTNEP